MLNLSHPLVFAHRGANREAAENTRTAFDLSLRHPIHGIETDVQLTRDNVLVLWHDRFLAKLDLPDKHVDDLSYAELAALNVASLFAADAPFESIMTLESFVARYAARCYLLIEVKNRDWEQLSRHQHKMRMCADLLGRMKNVWLSSFNLASLVYTHDYAPYLPLIYNVEPEMTSVEIQQCLRDQPFLAGYCLPVALLNEHIVGLLRKHGKTIAVYTCNSAAEIQLAQHLAVDILISDVPQDVFK